MVAIDIEHLSKKFGDFTALSDVSIDVQPKEFVTLLGPSGCGKTTLLKLISGFLEPTDGVIKIGGLDVTHVPPEKRDTALCFQSYALFPHLTVKENLEFGPRQKKISSSERKARIDDVSEKLDLTAQLDKLPNQLSGGQQQRVSLGRALTMRPSVILFDEPLSNLDAKLRDQVRIEIRRIQKEYGLTAIYVTHDQAEALSMSDRIVVLNDGRVEQVDSPERLYYAPKTRFVADFIGDANIIKAEVENKKNTLYNLKLGEVNLDINSSKNLNKSISVALRPEKINIDNDKKENSLSGKIISASFVGNSYQYITSTSVGKIYVISNDTINNFKLDDEVFLSFNKNDIKILDD